MKYFKDTKTAVKGKEVFCGIDVHDKHWDLCFVCDERIVERARMPADYRTLKALLMKQYHTAQKVGFVYEAGFNGYSLYRQLSRDGYGCIVASPNRLPRVNTKVKTDRLDAQALAVYLSQGAPKSVSVPSEQAESDRRLIRRRRQLVANQTRVKNQIKSLLHLHGRKTPKDIKSGWTQRYLAWLRGLCFAYSTDTFILTQLITSYCHVHAELTELDRYLRKLSRESRYKKNFTRLTKVKGVGLITAMTFLLELFHLDHFSNSRKFSSYTGMSPSQHSTGDRIRMGHITHQGNAQLRHALVESAWTVIRYDSHLRAKYNRLRARGTNGKKAIVAVARSLAVRLRRCILDDTDYILGHH